MLSNPGPWLALAALAGVVLYFKGYIPLPARAEAQRGPTTDAASLGHAYFEAKRIEAERLARESLHAEIDKVITARFAAPFSLPDQPTSPAAPGDRPQ